MSRLTAFAVLAVVAFAAACTQTEEELQESSPTPSAGGIPTASSLSPLPTPITSETPEGVVWRWGNVSITVPDGSGISVQRDFASPYYNPPDGGPVLEILRGESGMLIDANDARLIRDTVATGDRDVFASALATLKLDSTQPKSWPYAGTPPVYAKRIFAGIIAYWEPEPAAGMIAYGVVNDSPDGAMWVVLQNTRSRRTIDAKTGQTVLSRDNVHSEDEEAFERWAGSVDLNPQ